MCLSTGGASRAEIFFGAVWLRVALHTQFNEECNYYVIARE